MVSHPPPSSGTISTEERTLAVTLPELLSIVYLCAASIPRRIAVDDSWVASQVEVDVEEQRQSTTCSWCLGVRVGKHTSW